MAVCIVAMLAVMLVSHYYMFSSHLISDTTTTATNQEELVREGMELESKLSSSVTNIKNNRYELVYDSNLTALWLGEVDNMYNDVDVEDNNVNENVGIKVSMIISHCDKPLDWIWRDFMNSHTHIRNEDIIVYSKCGKLVEGVPSNVEVVQLPNVGRNDHTYAHHLCQMMMSNKSKHDDDDDDIVIFMKDNPQRMEWWGRRSLNQLVRITKRNGFGCIEQEEEFNTMHPSFYHEFSTWIDYSNKDGYVREKDRDENESFSSKYKNLGAWVQALNLAIPKPLGTCFVCQHQLYIIPNMACVLHQHYCFVENRISFHSVFNSLIIIIFNVLRVLTRSPCMLWRSICGHICSD